MAKEAIKALSVASVTDFGDVSLEQAREFHGDVFTRLGLEKDYWTLYEVFEVLPKNRHFNYWESVLDLAGSPSGELFVAAKTHSEMRVYGAQPQHLDQAGRWISRLESPRVISATSTMLLAHAERFAGEIIPSLAGPAADSLSISINSDPIPEVRLKDENHAVETVRDGYAVSEPTHKLLLRNEALNLTDFLSTQISSLTTGGIRPGELQIDPNVRPNEYLQQSFIDKGAECSPTERLQNSLLLNNLGANTTDNVFVDPLLLDLSGAGVNMTSIQEGTVFDIDNSGMVKRTGWVGAGTGLLVLDDGSGTIRHGGQLISEYLGGAAGVNGQPGEAKYQDAFAALASLDSNTDGVLSSADVAWRALKVWTDENRNGQSEAGELKALEEWAITEIKVAASPVNTTHASGNTVRSAGDFTIGGEQREALAVNFLSDSVSHRVHSVEGGQRIESRSADSVRTSFVTTSDVGVTLDAQALGAHSIQGGLGDDTLKASPEGSWLAGGGGSNRYEGGQGDDVFLITASDNTSAISGGGGRDTAIIMGDGAVSLNLGKAGLLMAQGGRGHDVLTSGSDSGVFIKGGSGGSTIFGGAGNDVLVGGQGRNTIIGGSGKSVIYAGPKDDLIYGSLQGSIIYAGAGPARITGRDADDVIEAGKGNATVDGGGGVNLVTLHGNHGDYVITPTETGYRIEDKVDGRDGVLTLTRIQKLNFEDISAVTLGGPNAMPVADVIRTDAAGAPLSRKDGARIIAAATLLANDQAMGSQGPLRISEVSDGLGGSVALNEQGDVVFTPDAAGQGAMSFKYALVDAVGNPAMGVESLKTGEVAPMRGEVHLVTDQVPTDPLAARQWYLGDVGVLPVWEQYSGRGVRVGIFEPGGEFAVAPETFDIHHPDLAPNVDAGWLAAQKQSGTLPGQYSNHATQVAGVVAAARDGQGGVGVAHGATLGGHYLANRGDDLTSLSNTSHYDVANNSWGFTNDFALTNLTGGKVTTETALMLNAQYAARNGRGGLGTVIVTAGGNKRAEGGSSQGSLTNSHRYAIQVGAINAQGDLSTLQVGTAPFSSPGTSLLVSAPGSNVLSTSRKLDTERGSVFGSDYSATQGTSFAAPIVSGVVALMLEANPSLGYRDVQRILALSATHVADPTTQWQYNGARNWNGGGMRKSDDYGFGKVDARAAVRLAESWSATSTLANEAQTGVSNTEVNLAVTAGQSVRSEHVLKEGVKVEHIELDVYSEVGQLGDLQLRLTSPSGTQSLLLDRAGKKRSGKGAGEADRGSHRSGAFNYTFTSTQHWGEHSQGAWTLEAFNAADGKPITLNSWAIRAYGQAASPDDNYVYTDAFASIAQEPARAVLDDAVNGTAGGFNTLNGAALSGDARVDLQSGNALLAGQSLAITAPASFGHVIGGDGNDHLIASSQGTVLEGGRGMNTLTGGAGKDLYVVRQRVGGNDTVQGFEAAKGELIHVSGTGVSAFTEMSVAQDGKDTAVSLPNGQRITLLDTAMEGVTAGHFRFDRRFELPAGYFESAATPEPEVPTPRTGEVILGGGAEGVGLSFGPNGAEAELKGTVYERSGAGAATFVAARQEGETDLRNALRGFNPGTDQFDLSQLGISSWSDLLIEKQQRIVINGLPLANGTSIKTKPNAEGKFIDVMYIDGLDPAQLAENHFVFAAAGSMPYLPEPAPAMPQPLLAERMAFDAAATGPSDAGASVPSSGTLLQAIAGFAPQGSTGAITPFEVRQSANTPLLTQVA